MNMGLLGITKPGVCILVGEGGVIRARLLWLRVSRPRGGWRENEKRAKLLFVLVAC